MWISSIIAREEQPATDSIKDSPGNIQAAAALDGVFPRALQPDRKMRFHSAHKLCEALRDALPA